MQMVHLRKEGKDFKQKWTVTVPWCRPNKFWCQDYHHQQHQHQQFTKAGIWTKGKLNYIFYAEFGSLLCSDFWGLVTPLCLFLTHIYMWMTAERVKFIYFRPVVSIFNILLSICFPNWQLNSVFFTLSIFLMASDNISASQSCLSQVAF